MDPVPEELGWTSYRTGTFDSWRGPIHSRKQDYVAEEVPVVLVYNTIPHVVMLTTPLNLEDFGLGFSLTEDIIRHPAELLSVKVVQRAKGVEVRMQIPEARFDNLHGKGKNMTGRTGCGLCGATTLEQAIRPARRVGDGSILDAALLSRAFESMQQQQALNLLTGAVHAAAWLEPERGIAMVREDVGRHNALDKLIGALARTGCDFSAGWLLVTSRASYEMVQKAASVGISLLAAISAPTALAIRLADECGLTLVGFTRNENHTIYTHPFRLQHYQESAA
ncbi:MULTISPECIES: formate dehydrogenase accessory sulfurtransferase FdhD [Methylomonas]|uniref:Sulfur carrier protein FdhD n=1 Tax=Methylomonas koyamae TaxID=702114 RepID=A0A177NHU1_9GAMM|nr:formate dehydrogenase accessory sulfurtransferase FdhD [Methylomonas koyamae]NJA07301.1 formate dehydrogenase accessory sulfurtransferase FdhD [Methylococcaceae bacterium WWC4]OAI17451.1 sufurtransferase FdhD [Methylomonas koyamae]